MRKIETLMNDAISENIDWRSGNTAVVYDHETSVSCVYLHGNRIARVGDNFIELYDGGYQSATTKSRLNAILHTHGANFDGIFQKNFQWFFHDSLRSQDVPFESGMTI